MSTSIRNRALALGSACVLAFTGISALPAAAGVGDVELAPTSGANYGAFSTDAFSLDADVTTLISPDNLAYKIVSTGQEILDITMTGGAATVGLSVLGFSDLGVAVDLDSIDDTTGGSGSGNANATEGSPDDTDGIGQPTLAGGKFQLDFDELDITSAVLYLSTDNSETNTLEIQAMKGTSTAYEYGDGSPSSITVQAWVEAEATPDYTTVDAAYASPIRTVTWYDPAGVSAIPRIERFQDSGGTNRLNDTTTGGNVAGSLQFANSNINLDQVDITQWDYKIGNSDDDGYNNVSTVIEFDDTDDLKLNSGQTTHDASGKIFFVLNDETDTAIDLNSTKDYIVSVKNDGANSVYFASAAFAPASNSAGVDQIEATVTSATDSLQADADTTAITLRAGTKAFTYTAQTKTEDDTNSTASSIQVLAVVKSGAYLSTDGGLTVSGSSTGITKKNQAVLVTGFTDSDGQYSVTVTSTNAAASESYTVQFYVLDGTNDEFDTVLNVGTASTYTATYQAATATTLKAAATVLSGDSVTASFTVVDQFDQVTNMSGTKAVSVELKASNDDNLDKDAVVAADGTASFTFDNYVTTGSADVITATTYTGTSASPTALSGSLVKTLTLYNAIDGAAVQVPETATGVITYDDFITGEATTAAPAPNDATFTYTGTVVDANGSGVPAASVTIAADGFQFLGSGSSYVQDEITVSANAAGVFTVSMWSHVVATAGVDVTVTSGTNTATTLVKTYLPENLSAGNLDFKLNLPSAPIMNTTYAMTATLADKWGNPVATSANGFDNGVKFIGVGSVEINSVSAEVEKNFDKTGTSTVFLRSIKDIAGPGSVTATMEAASYTFWNGSATATDQLIITEVLTDVTTTAWDETSYEAEIASNVEIYETAADVPSAVSSQKVNAGSFKGYVALYALGYEGQRMSAKVGNDWVVVAAIPAATNDLFRAVEFVGAGVEISVRLYIDRVLVDTIPLLTK